MGRRMNEQEQVMLISTEEYRELIRVKTEYELLIVALFDGARLDYTGKDLNFDDDAICVMLKAMESDDYSGVVHELQREKAEKEALDGNV